MRTLGIGVAGVGIIVGTILGTLFKGEFFYCNFCVGIVILIAAIGGPVCPIMIDRDRSKRGLVRTGTKIMFGGCILLCVSLPLSIFVGQSITRQQVSKAKQFVSIVVPKIDEYHQENGQFPRGIAAVYIGPIPSLLGSDGGYKSDGTDFRFLISDPTGVAKFFYYRSGNREWELTDHVGFLW